MNIPSGLLQKVQYDYVDSKYKEGLNIFPSLDNSTIECIINSFLSWAESSGLVVDDQLNLSLIAEKLPKKKA